MHDLMQPLRVHHAVVVHYRGKKIYGRVEGHDGIPLDDMHPIIHVRTPGGSLIKVGRIWVRPASDVDLARLKGFEFAHKEDSARPLYDSSPS